MLKAVIFDLDGVLMKFNLDSKAIKEEVILFFENSGLEIGLLNPQEPFSEIKETVRSYFTAAGKDGEWIDALLRKAENIPVEHEIRSAYATELLPNVEETLRALRSMGMKLGVFTYNNSEAATIALRKNGIDSYFDALVARDMVTRPKPNPIHLDAALKRLNVSKEEAICVGDSEMDIKPCKERGVTVVAITTGIRGRQFLSQLKPDYLIGDLHELLAIVRNLASDRAEDR